MVQVLLSTSQFVAGILGIFLDNTIPGTKKERGLLAWNSTERFSDSDFDVYDIPWLRCVTDLPFMKFCPISPAFRKEKREAESQQANIDETQN